MKKRGRDDVEIKGLINRRDKHPDFAGCTSPIELWANWASCTLDLDGPPLIRLEKQRWKRNFLGPRQRRLQACASEPVPRPSGCDAELTLLKAPDMALTLGFEAYGELDESNPYFLGPFCSWRPPALGPSPRQVQQR